MKQTFTTSDGIHLAYTIDDYTDPWKSAPTLLMLHSAMSSAKRFYSMVPGLAKHYRVIRLDSRGHGESEVPPPHLPHDKERLNQDVIELLDRFDIEKTHILAERIVYENARHNVFDYLPERCVAGAVAFLRKHFPGEGG